MSMTGAKRSKTIPEVDPLEPTIVYESEPDAREWQARRIRAIWRLRRIPLRAFAAAAALSLIGPWLIPNSYQATTQLMPPDSNSASSMAMIASLASKAGPLSSLASDLFDLKTSSGLFIGVLTSEHVQDQLVRQFDLVKVYKVRNGEEAHEKLNDRTNIREDKSSGIISISVIDRSPQRAAAIANAYVSQLNGLIAELSTSSAHRERVFLEERLKVVKQDLDNASNQLAQFSSNTRTLDPRDEGKAMLDAAGNLTAQIIAAQSQLEGLRQIYTDLHPRVKALNARIAEMQRELQKLGGNLPQTQAVKQNAKIDTQPPDTTGLAGQDAPSIRTLPLLGAKYSDYYRRLRIEEAAYELLNGQYELAKVEEAKELPAIKVLDVAVPPLKKFYPHRLLMMILGLCVSFGIATACWFFAMLWNDVDPLDPRLIVVTDVIGQVRAQLPWNTKNGLPSSIEPEARNPSIRTMRPGQQEDPD